jgi:hypothetical protein
MGAPIKVKVIGLKKVERELKRLGKRGPKLLGSAFFQIAEEIIGESKEAHVPVDTSALKNSGFVEMPQTTSGGGVFVEAGFGGPAGKGNLPPTSNKKDVGYALIVHENTQLQHPRGGRAKYLEIPFNQAKSQIDRRAVELMRIQEPLFK